MIVTVGDKLPRQARGHIGDGCHKWKHLLHSDPGLEKIPKIQI